MSDGDAAAAALQAATLKDFEFLSIIGVGTFGRVFLARLGDDYYAIKVMNKDQVLMLRQKALVTNERAMLAQLTHPFIVKMHRAFQDRRNIYLVMEYCAGGALNYHLAALNKMPEAMAKFYAAELILALDNLHQHGYIYRDVKPENILVANDGHFKLSDFGVAKQLKGPPPGDAPANKPAEGTPDSPATPVEAKIRRRTFTLCGTPSYTAPEVINRTGHDYSADWWSLGVLIYEMLTGEALFDAPNMFKIHQIVLSQTVEFPDSLSQPARDLLGGLLQKDPELRLKVDAIKAHPFFEGIDFDALHTLDAPLVLDLESPDDIRYCLDEETREYRDRMEEEDEDDFFDDDDMLGDIPADDTLHGLTQFDIEDFLGFDPSPAAVITPASRTRRVNSLSSSSRSRASSS